MDEVVGADVPLLLLRGDSGIGKSALLVEAQLATDDALAPEPVVVFASEGAVQQALLDSLGSALALLVSEEPWRSERAQIITFLRRLIARGAAEARRVAGLAVVSQVRKRLGEHTISALAEVWHEAEAANAAAIGGRIAGATDPRFVQDLIGLASELRDLSGRSKLIVALDGLELLTDHDLRILADLARTLPEGLLIRAAVLDASSSGSAALLTLRSTAGESLSDLTVGPLGFPAVRAMLADADVDLALTSDILRMTGGYPLHIGDALLHLQQGGGIHDLPVNRNFGRIVEQNWSGIDGNTRQIARLLCLLERPVSVDVICSVLQISELEWWDAADRLRESRIFTQVVDELPWFHEQRRRWLIGQLEPREKRSSAARIVPTVTELLSEPDGWRYCVTLAGLVESAGDELAGTALRDIAMLPDEELAVTGALLELSDAGPVASVDAQAAIGHARHRFAADGDLVRALQRLEELELVVVTSDGWAAEVMVELELPGAALVAGRCLLRFGTMPVPCLASAIWNTLLGPLARPFELAMYGVGSPRPGDLVRDTHRTQLLHMDFTRSGFDGCVAYGEHRSTSLYACVATQPSETGRVAEGWLGASTELAGGTFRVRDILTFPAYRLRAQRWSIASDDVLGKAPSREDSGLSLNAELEILSRSREAVREGLSNLERLATGLTFPMHYFFSEAGGKSTIIHVRGLTEGVTRLADHQGVLFNDAFSALRLAADIGLPSDASVVHVTTGDRLDRTHPLRQLSKELASRALEYNYTQPRVEIDLTPGSLELWLEERLQERHHDALRLHAVLADGTPPPACLEAYLVTSPAPADYPIPVPPAAVAVRAAERSAVRYALLDQPIQGWGYEQLADRFPEVAGLAWSGHAVVDEAIAGLAGYSREDVSTFRSVRRLGLLGPSS